MASEPVTPVEIAAEFEVTRGRVLGLVEQMAVCRALIAVTAERDRLLAALVFIRKVNYLGFRERVIDLLNDAINGVDIQPPTGHTHPRPCSICRREDCTTEHACE